MSNQKELIKIISKSLFFSSIVWSLGSVELSSKFSVINFAKDQATLDRARDALESFIVVASVWMAATVLSLYASHGWCGAFWALFFSSIITGSIILSYFKSFEQDAKEHNLTYPETYSKKIWMMILGSLSTLLLYFAYKCGYTGLLKKSVNSII